MPVRQDDAGTVLQAETVEVILSTVKLRVSVLYVGVSSVLNEQYICCDMTRCENVVFCH